MPPELKAKLRALRTPSSYLDDPKDDLPPRPLLEPLEGLARVGELEDPGHGRSQLTTLDEPGELDQLLAARLDHEVDAGDPGRARRLRGDGNEPSAGTKGGERTLEPLAAGGVEDEVDAAVDILERRGDGGAA